jgi:hypothetical protein
MAKHKLPPWLRPKPLAPNVKVGVAWYTEDQWRLVKAAATDAERFEETYPDWVAMAEVSTKNMLAAGIVAEHVPVIASDLLAWCLTHGKQNNAAARAEFASEDLSRRHERDA